MTEIKLVRSTLANSDNYGIYGKSEFDTYDYVFINSKEEIEALSDEERMTEATDYSVMNGALVGKKKLYSSYFLRSNSNNLNMVDFVSLCGQIGNVTYNDTFTCIRPVLRLSLSSVEPLAKENLINFSAKTITLGKYPTSNVRYCQDLEMLLKNCRLKHAKKSYFNTFLLYLGIETANQYELFFKNYVRVLCDKYSDFSHFANGLAEPSDGSFSWAEVEPIVWKINNFKDLPKQINPNGSGKAKFIELQTEKAILAGIPFYIGREANNNLWQNSLIRAYLNGYNLHKEIEQGNGNKNFATDVTFDLQDRGFLQEASILEEISKINEKYGKDTTKGAFTEEFEQEI